MDVLTSIGHSRLLDLFMKATRHNILANMVDDE